MRPRRLQKTRGTVASEFLPIGATHVIRSPAGRPGSNRSPTRTNFGVFFYRKPPVKDCIVNSGNDGDLNVKVSSELPLLPHLSPHDLVSPPPPTLAAADPALPVQIEGNGELLSRRLSLLAQLSLPERRTRAGIGAAIALLPPPCPEAAADAPATKTQRPRRSLPPRIQENPPRSRAHPSSRGRVAGVVAVAAAAVGIDDVSKTSLMDPSVSFFVFTGNA